MLLAFYVTGCFLAWVMITVEWDEHDSVVGSIIAGLFSWFLVGYFIAHYLRNINDYLKKR